jgi:hypothetical protein
MDKTFVETRDFTEWVRHYMSDEALAGLQRLLLKDPEIGVVMRGCGGLRKMRVGDPRRRKGKSGGARAIYLHVPEADVIFLMDIYGKDEQADLTADQKGVLKSLSDQYKRAAIESARNLRKGTS